MMDQWDPMKDAFENKSFNSYNQGVGRDLIGSHQRDRGIRLYVQNIPVSLGKIGLYNLFAEYGKVLHHDLKISESSTVRGAYGFVTMENMLDAEIAIRKLHNKKLGHFILRVSPALSEEEKNRRKHSKQFLQDREQMTELASQSTLEMNRGDWHSQQQVNSLGRGRSIQMTDRGDANHTLHGSLSHIMGIEDRAPTSSQALRGKQCVLCYKEECVNKCSRCKMYYCSTECQNKDWPRHKDICITIGEMYQCDPAHNIGSNGNINHANSSQGLYGNKDMEATKYHMTKDPQMKMTNRDRHVSNYDSDTGVIETDDKKNNKEQNNLRSGHQISRDKAGSSQFASKLQNSKSDHLRSSHNNHLAESQSSHYEKASLLTISDQGGQFKNENKLPNYRCNPMENILSNSETHKHYGEETLAARATHSDLKFNKFQNNRNEFEESNAFSNKTISQKSPPKKAAVNVSSKQESQFKNKNDITESKDNQRNISKRYMDKTTNETNMRSPNYQNQIEESHRSPSQLNAEIKTEKVSGAKTVPMEAKSASPSALELSLAIKTSGSCYLTYFENPFKFWISLQQFLESFAENTILMEKEFSKMHTSSPIECHVGDTYGVMYMGEWCRVNVVSIRGRDVTVFYLDYGNQSTVQQEDLRPVTKEMLELPAQAVCCCVSKVRPIGSDSWNEASCTAVREWFGEPMTTFLQYEIVAKKGSVHIVNISHKNMTMREFLLSRGFAEPVNYELGLPSLNNMNSVKEPGHPRHMAYELASIMDEKKTGDSISVVLTDFISTTRFIVLDLASHSLLNEMTSLLQSEYTNSTVSYRPVQGELVAAKYSEDGKWYRAEVTGIDGDSCAVFFVDYGNSDVQMVENIRLLTKQNLIDVPKHAIICRLFALQSLSDYGMDFIDKEFHTLLAASFTSEGHCTLQVKENRKDTLLVDVFARSGASLTELLVRRLSERSNESMHQRSLRQTHDGQIASKVKSLTSPSAAENISHPVRRDTVTALNLGAEKLPRVSPVKPTAIERPSSTLSINMEILPGTKELIPVTFTHIESGSKLFISPKDTSLQSELCQVMRKLNEPTHPLSHLDNIITGSVCAAQYSQDGTWYRARVVEVCNQTTCIVHFVDYGNSEKTEISNLREIEPALTKLPGQAICCCLFGYESCLDEAFPPTSGTDDMVHKLQSELMEKIMYVRVMSRKQDSYIIEVENGSGECISRLFLPPSPQTVSTLMLSDLIFESPSEKEFDAVFSYIKSMSEFYCQRSDREELEELETLNIKLRDEASKIGDFYIDPRVYGIYASKFMGNWYRCVVEEVKMPNVVIRYIDYGNSEQIPANQLRPLNPEQMMVPVRLLKCKLHGVAPVQEDWNSPEMGEYLQILQQSKVHLVTETKEKDNFLVSLFVLNGSVKVNVAEDLVDIGVAKFLKVLSPQREEVRPNLPYPHGQHLQNLHGQPLQNPQRQPLQNPQGQHLQNPQGQPLQNPQRQHLQNPQGQHLQNPHGQHHQNQRGYHHQNQRGHHQNQRGYHHQNPHGHHHQAQDVESDSEDEDELEIQRKIQELQMQLQLSQKKKKQKH